MSLNLDECLSQNLRPLPVVFLLDVSGSMHGDKMESLNTSMQQCLRTLREHSVELEYLVSVVLFGTSDPSGVRVLVPPTAIQDVHLETLSAYGATPLGTGLRVTKQLIEDRSQIPSSAYRPTVVLLSDGIPTDDWQTPLEQFVNFGRSSKCDRMSIAVGESAINDPHAYNVLKSFVEGGDFDEVLQATDSVHLYKIFNYVTMSVSSKATRLSHAVSIQQPIQTPSSVSISTSSFSQFLVEEESSSEDS